MPSLDLFNPLPALNKWFSKRNRHPKENSEAKVQEWFAGVFQQAAGDGRLHNLHINSDATTEDDALNTHVEF